MSRTVRHRLVATLTAGVLGCTLLATALGSTQAQAATGGAIRLSPSTYVGGQSITLSGRLPAGGSRVIRLQEFMGRPGDIWFYPAQGVTGRTASDGSFTVRFPAPDMLGVRVRMVSGSLASPSVLLESKVQSADLWVSGADPSSPDHPGTLSAGVPFGISVDTTPELPGRQYAWGTPAFPGRQLTLQKRVSPTSWTTLARTVELSGGRGYFSGLTESLPGTVVYRVLQGSLLTGGNRVGWSTSYPTYLTVSGPGYDTQAPVPPTGTRYDAWQPLPAAGSPLATTMRSAFSSYGWGRKLFGFDWERGESLASAPDRGTGHWVEYSDGSGRASKLNGMLSLDARRENRPGTGDLGTTMATLVGSAQRYGRWEARLNVKNHESDQRDYDVRVELVPALASQYACGARNILLGQVRAHSDALTFGVKNGTRNWSQTRRLSGGVTGYPALAVEVEPGHITWYYAGRPIGTVRSSAAVSDVPLTLRISLVGRGTEEMNQTVAGSDWQRGWAATGGRQVISGAPLRYGVQPHRCDS